MINAQVKPPSAEDSSMIYHKFTKLFYNQYHAHFSFELDVIISNKRCPVPHGQAVPDGHQAIRQETNLDKILRLKAAKPLKREISRVLASQNKKKENKFSHIKKNILFFYMTKFIFISIIS